MKAPDKPRGKEGLGVIKRISTFQGKCDILQDTCFPANVPIPPPIPDNWLATLSNDEDNRFTQVTIIEIDEAFRSSDGDSATGMDNVSYRMVAAVQQPSPGILPRLFSSLIKYRAFPFAWKTAKCVPISKPEQTDMTDSKNLRPISLLSCVSTTFEKILARRIASIIQATGAIFHEQFGPLSERSLMDALMVTPTPAQQWLREPWSYYRATTRPSILDDDIDGAFNCRIHERLTKIFTHFGVYSKLITIIASFRTNRRICLDFDGQREAPVPSRTGLTQGSPLSPLLIVIYATALIPPGEEPLNRQRTSYENNELMTEGATSQEQATVSLQERINIRIQRAITFNIQQSQN